MPGPSPKDSSVRQRRNRTSTAAQLPAQGPKRRAPKLPDRRWHPMTVAWWRDVWRSPMAHEFLEADVHGLFMLADLIDRYWLDPSKDLAAEIRLQRQSFGLTPLDRRRLQWEVERAEQAGRKREKPAAAPRPKEGGDDPRKMLRAV